MKLAVFKFALLAVLAAIPARALSVLELSSDEAFAKFTAAASWSQEAGVNVRWGNNGKGGLWEMALVDAKDNAVAGTTRQGKVDGYRAFGFDYAKGTATAALAGFKSAQTTLGDAELNTVIIRVQGDDAREDEDEDDDGKGKGKGKNQDDDDDASVAALAGLSISFGSEVYSLGQLVGDNDSNYLVLQDTRFSGVWSLLADGVMYHDRDDRDRAPFYSVRLGTTTTSVPDSAATFGLLAATLLGTILIRRRMQGGKQEAGSSKR